MAENRSKIFSIVMETIKSNDLGSAWRIRVEPRTSTMTGHHYVWMALTEPRCGHTEYLAFPTDMPSEQQPIAAAINETIATLKSCAAIMGATA